MIAMNGDAALVLFSGGQDSTTCLAWALARFAQSRRSASTMASGMQRSLSPGRACYRGCATIFRDGASLGADHVLPLASCRHRRQRACDPMRCPSKHCERPAHDFCAGTQYHVPHRGGGAGLAAQRPIWWAACARPIFPAIPIAASDSVTAIDQALAWAWRAIASTRR